MDVTTVITLMCIRKLQHLPNGVRAFVKEKDKMKIKIASQ